MSAAAEQVVFSSASFTEPPAPVLMPNVSAAAAAAATGGHGLLDAVESLSGAYLSIHNPLVISMCVLGIPSHLCIIATLTRQDFWTASNALMVSLSVSQLGLVLAFLFSTGFVQLQQNMCIQWLWHYAPMLSFLVSINMSIFCHTCAVFHVISITMVRFITLQFFAERSGGQAWFSMRRAKATCLGIYVFTALLCVPFYLNSEVDEVSFESANASCESLSPDTVYFNLRYSNMSLANDRLLLTFNFWFFSIICKLVPCLLLAVMTVLLTIKLMQFEKKSRLLANKSGKGASNNANLRQYRWTTYFILTVVVLFIVVETPQGLMSCSMGLFGPEHYSHTLYELTAEFFNMLTMLYSSINFLLYCLMNGQFRQFICSRLLLFARQLRCGRRCTSLGGAAGSNGKSATLPSAQGQQDAVAVLPSPGSHRRIGPQQPPSTKQHADEEGSVRQPLIEPRLAEPEAIDLSSSRVRSDSLDSDECVVQTLYTPL